MKIFPIITQSTCAFSILVFALSTTPAHALLQHNKLWLSLNVQQSLDKEKKWLFSFYTQSRLIQQVRCFESAFVENALGYQLENSTLWLGFRLTKHVSNPPTFQLNHLFQQFIYLQDFTCFSFLSRSRLEQMYRSDQKEFAFRFRQRMAFELSGDHFINVRPLIYNEVFLALNQTNYTSHKFLNENRLFFGFNCYQQNNIWWEIGYMLQYRANIPISHNRQSHLDHVLVITYNYR
jgi:hypothetical protein